MIFSSSIFVFGFLPLFLTAYYCVPKSPRSIMILIGSYAFYGWWRVDYLAVVFGMSAISFLVAHVAYTARNETIKAWAVRLGVCFYLAVLGYFKYTVFAMSLLADLSMALR